MNCAFCLHADTKVVDSRLSGEGHSIRRRRECLKCKKRFTTYENVESVHISIIKRDGRRQSFDRNKVLKGILTACEKRPISRDIIERAVSEVESQLRRTNKSEIHSRRVGRLVMDQLENIDDVAYVRFASVYRSFKDTEQFMREIERLRKLGKS